MRRKRSKNSVRRTWSLKTLYRLFGFLDKIEAQMKFYDVQRMRILGEYCRLENGDMNLLRKRKLSSTKEFNELMNLDVDLGDTELPIEISEKRGYKTILQRLNHVKEIHQAHRR